MAWIQILKSIGKGKSEVGVVSWVRSCPWSSLNKKNTWDSLGCKGIKPVNPKRNQSWLFIRRTDAETEAPILWPIPDAKSQLIGKDPDAGKDWGQEEKRVIEDEMVGWHHPLHGHEFEQALGDNEGQGSLVSCSPRGRKEPDTTERLNNNNTWTHSLISPPRF